MPRGSLHGDGFCSHIHSLQGKIDYFPQELRVLGVWWAQMEPSAHLRNYIKAKSFLWGRHWWWHPSWVTQIL